MPTSHVILVTYGEPPTPSFVDQLVYSWRILLGLTRTVAPIPKAALPMIALARGYGRHKLWRAAQYASPLEAITVQQADSVRRALETQSQPGDWAMHVAYEFRRPLLTDVLAEIAPDDPIWVAPMYATESAFTHALSRAAMADAVTHHPRRATATVLPALDIDQLADASVAHLLQHLEDVDMGTGVALVLAAHGTLLEPARPIETGRCVTERLYGAIRARVATRFGLVLNGWLNHTRGGRWTEPPIDQTLHHVRDAGYSRVVYFPFGFLADNAESQLEGRMALAAHPSITARHVPCLNESDLLAQAIAAQVMGDGARGVRHLAGRHLQAAVASGR